MYDFSKPSSFVLWLLTGLKSSRARRRWMNLFSGTNASFNKEPTWHKTIMTSIFAFKGHFPKKDLTIEDCTMQNSLSGSRRRTTVLLYSSTVTYCSSTVSRKSLFTVIRIPAKVRNKLPFTLSLNFSFSIFSHQPRPLTGIANTSNLLLQRRGILFQ